MSSRHVDQHDSRWAGHSMQIISPISAYVCKVPTIPKSRHQVNKTSVWQGRACNLRLYFSPVSMTCTTLCWSCQRKCPDIVKAWQRATILSGTYFLLVFGPGPQAHVQDWSWYTDK